MILAPGWRVVEADTDVLPDVRHLSKRKEQYNIMKKGEGFVS